MGNTSALAIFISIAIILVSQILVTEYRIKREKEENLKSGCPTCPKCKETN